MGVGWGKRWGSGGVGPGGWVRLGACQGWGWGVGGWVSRVGEEIMGLEGGGG